jgi:hypothetical protein
VQITGISGKVMLGLILIWKLNSLRHNNEKGTRLKWSEEAD